MRVVSKRIRELLENNRDLLIKADSTTSKIPNGICYDGIVNEECFYAQPKKIIFLLKETNGNDDGGNARESYDDWDYRAWLEHQQANNEPGDKDNRQSFYPTYRKVCMWIDVFFDTLEGKHIPYSEYKKSGRYETDILRKNLNKTAIINLKKTWGGASTSWESLYRYLQNRIARDVVRKQVEDINPDVVICGGDAFDFAKQIFSDNAVAFVIKTKIKNVDCFRAGNRIFIRFYHPSYYGKKNEVFYDFGTEVFNALHAMQ